MAVIIETMDVPKTCDECLSGFVKTIGCNKRQFFNERDIKRHPECPIKEVKVEEQCQKT